MFKKKRLKKKRVCLAGYGDVRINGEMARTVGQLNKFADLVRGSQLSLSKDTCLYTITLSARVTHVERLGLSGDRSKLAPPNH